MSQVKYQIRYALPVWFVSLITSVLPDNRYTIRVRGWMLSLFLPNRPKKLTVGRDVTLLGLDKLAIGQEVYLAKGTWINALGGVKIGDRVMLSPYVIIASVTHGFSGGDFHGPSSFKNIVLGEGCWVASHSTITSGVTVGECSLVGANSTVIDDVEDRLFVSGVPAKRIRRL